MMAVLSDLVHRASRRIDGDGERVRPGEASKPLSYRSDIDGLRAIAVMPVLFYHAGVAGFSGGYAGVDVFFVISGYLITSIVYADIVSGRFSLARFYERRIRRLLPALVAVIVVTTLLSTWLLLPTPLKDYGQSLLSVALFASNVLFWKEAGYFDAPAELKPLLHTWSLAVEEQYYLFFPPLLYLLCKHVPERVSALIFAAFLASLAACVAMVGSHQSATFYLLPFRAWEMLIGSLLALGFVPRPGSRRTADIQGALGLALIAGPVLLYSSSTPFPGIAAVPPVLGAALVIHAGAFPGALAGRLLSVLPLVGVGMISYSLYLWHWPITVFTKYLNGGALSPSLQLLVITGSMAAAVLSWRYIEKPFRRPAVPAPRSRLFIGAVGTVAAFGVVGLGLHLTRGLPARVPPDARPLAAALEDFEPHPQSCRPWSGPDRLGEGLCVIGGPASREPDFMMWGDSHSGILVHAIEGEAYRLGKVGLFSNLAGCPPLVGVAKDESVADAAEDAKCARLNARILDILRRSTGIEKVLLVGRWSYYANGGGVGADAVNTVKIQPVGSPSASLGNSEVFAASMHATIETLIALNKKVYVLRQVPEIENYKPAALAAAAMFSRSTSDLATIATASRITIERVAVRQRAFDTAMKRWEADSRVRVLDSWPYFCDARECSAISGGEARYYDNNHVTTKQAKALAPLMSEVLTGR